MDEYHGTHSLPLSCVLSYPLYLPRLYIKKLNSYARISTECIYALLQPNFTNSLILDLCTYRFLAFSFICLFKEGLFIPYYVLGEYSSEQNNMVSELMKFNFL